MTAFGWAPVTNQTLACKLYKCATLPSPYLVFYQIILLIYNNLLSHGLFIEFNFRFLFPKPKGVFYVLRCFKVNLKHIEFVRCQFLVGKKKSEIGFGTENVSRNILKYLRVFSHFSIIRRMTGNLRFPNIYCHMI